VVKLEVYGSKHCQYTAELIEELEWQSVVFTYYDVDVDKDALEQMMLLTQNGRSIPVLVEDGKVKSVGYQGRSCIIQSP